MAHEPGAAQFAATGGRVGEDHHLGQSRQVGQAADRAGRGLDVVAAPAEEGVEQGLALLALDGRRRARGEDALEQAVVGEVQLIAKQIKIREALGSDTDDGQLLGEMVLSSNPSAPDLPPLD